LVSTATVASLGGGRADRPGDTLQGGDTRRKKIFVANLQRIVENKKGVKAIKSDIDSDSDEQKGQFLTRSQG